MERSVAQLITDACLMIAFQDLPNFHQQFGAKNKWIKMNPGELRKNPMLADEFFDLLSTAYKDIGGHAKLKKLTDLFDGRLSFVAIDLDKDPQADAVKISKKKPPGLKSVGLGHDGSDTAKKAVIKKSGELLKTKGYYAEMSGAIAHLMLTKYGVQSVNDEDAVRAVLQKDIEWLGPHPKGKYPKNPGWYRRSIGGKTFTKILVGLPLTRT